MSMDDGLAASPLAQVFEYYRTEIDDHHDRRERVIKASKDITANSKKIIFALHRHKLLGKPVSLRVLGDVDRLKEVNRALFEGVAPELQGLNAWRYQRQISGGIQEFMEAVLFQHFLETQRLMSLEDAQQQISGGVLLTYEDYLLGVFDMTGEVMKYAITNLATTANITTAAGEKDQSSRNALVDLQVLRMELEKLDVRGSYGLNKDWDGKLKVMKTSVEKVENGMYGMMVRGRERPPGWTPDLAGPRESDQVESY